LPPLSPPSHSPPPPTPQLLISKKSRRSREQAFVEFETIASAQAAIAAMDGIDAPALVKQPGCGGLVVRFADKKKEDEASA
jgi:RNA recognition motif-containing protein